MQSTPEGGNEARTADLTALLADAPIDAADHDGVRKFVHQLAEAGVAVLFILPGSKVPADMRTPQRKTADNRAAREAARQTGRRGWESVKAPSGVALATTNTDVLDGYLDRYVGTFSTWANADGNAATWSAKDAETLTMITPVEVSLAVATGPSALVVIDADTAAQTETFMAEVPLDDRRAPTVVTPGQVGLDGDPGDPSTWAHHDGGHWWFTVPEDVTLPTTTQTAKLGETAAVDDRYAAMWGRCYVLIPPSTRPEGAYAVAGGGVTELPDWLAEKITKAGDRVAERDHDAAPLPADAALADRIDAWAEGVSWAEILEPLGWRATGRRDGCGCPTWTASGEHASPKSATAHETGCTDPRYTEVNAPLHIWTDHPGAPFEAWAEARGKPVTEMTISKLQTVTAHWYDNDRGEAMSRMGLIDSDALAVTDLPADFGKAASDGGGSTLVGDERDGAGPGGLFVDIAAVLSGGGAPKAKPTVLTRRDGKCLFYRGKANLLFGDPETAKTWIALAAGAEELCSGGRFVFIDMDHNGVDTTVERLTMMGVAGDLLADPARFLYVEPEDRQHLGAVIKHLATWQPGVALLDSVGELLPLMGASSNSNDEVTMAFNATTGPLAKAGAAVVLIDHLAKNADSRRLGPVGAYGKTRIFNGAMVRVFRVEQFAPGQGGTSSLWVHKDRPGAVRRETVLPTDVGDGDDADDIRRDNLRRWGVFTMTSQPVLNGRGKPVNDADGDPLETLAWTINPPKGLRGAVAGADMPDPRKGGRPRGQGVTDVGSAKYEAAVRAIIVKLCKLMREGRINDKTAMSRVRDDFIKGAREPFTGAWERWVAADRPDRLVDANGQPTVPELTVIDPFDPNYDDQTD